MQQLRTVYLLDAFSRDPSMNKNTLTYLKTHVLCNIDKEHRKTAGAILESRNKKRIRRFVYESLRSNDSNLVGTAIMIAEATFTSSDRHVVLHVLKQLDHKNAWVRERAADSMKRFASNRLTEKLLSALDDKNPLVRTYLCEALSKITDPRSIPYLRKVLSDKNDLVRATALEALANFRKVITLEFMFKWLKDRSALTRLGALYALDTEFKLNKSSREEILRRLTAHLKVERDGLVRCDIFEMLYGYTNNPDMLNKLIQLTESKREIVRWRVYETLSSVANRSNASIISEVLSKQLLQEKAKGLKDHLGEKIKDVARRINLN